MLRIVLVRPGSTVLTDQGRIMGKLDIPLSDEGTHQINRTVSQLADLGIAVVYTSPCESAEQTASVIAKTVGAKVKLVEALSNLDQGLWQGKLIEEVRQKQPKVYRQWQEHPETICPPQGETLASAQQRVEKGLLKLMKKHTSGVIALVVPEPLASVVASRLKQSELGDLWKAECECGSWELIEVESPVPVHT